MVFKKCVFFVLSVLLCATVFAQTAPKKVLTAKDVDVFVAKFEAINAEFEALGDKYDNLIGDQDGQTSFSAVLAQTRSVTVPAEIQTILKKHGFGDNGFEKFMVISLGCSALEMERVMDEEMKGVEITAEMKPYFETAKVQITEMKAAFHPDDLKLIKAKQDKIITLLGSEE